MLNLHAIAERSRLRARARVNVPLEQDPKTFAAVNRPFNERLFEACQKNTDNPKGIPVELFVAAPERLMAKIAYLSLEKPKKDTPPPEGIPEATIGSLREFENEGQSAAFVNLETVEQVSNLKHVLLCHGLSPIGDSLLLLADIGRAFRVSRVLGCGMKVMLADISWMSSNRSIRQFTSLSPEEIDIGLRVCLDKRERLYNALEIQPDRHEIVSYNRNNKINGKKLEHISSRYLALAKLLWGGATNGRLTHQDVQKISRQLDHNVSQFDEETPPPIATLGHFPGVLGALEYQLKPHLEIMRVIAKEFSAFEEDVFKYFFAQYYAQDSYRGNCLKIAPVSEKAFDKPFDDLDKYFRAWGEGHSTTEVLTGSAPAVETHPMSAIYFPQYRIGKLSVLPYTPLSLDALRQEAKNHSLVQDLLIMLDDDHRKSEDQLFKKDCDLLKQTPLALRNRLVADIASFLTLCGADYSNELNNICKRCGRNSFEDMLAHVSPILPKLYARETAVEKSELIRELWSMWMKNIPIAEEPDYMPFHMFFYLLDSSDWSEDRFIEATKMCQAAKMIYQHFTGLS